VAGLLNATFSHRKQNRSQLAFTGRIGKTSFARIDYSIERTPLRSLDLAYLFNYQDLSVYDYGVRTFNTSYSRQLAEVAYSDMNWLNFKLKVGMRYEYFKYNSFLYAGESGNYSEKPEGYFSYFLQANVETFDRAYFPTKGVSIRADYSMYTDNLVSYHNRFPFIAVGLNFTLVAPLNASLDLLPSIYVRSLIGDEPAFPFLNVIGGEIAGKYVPQQIPFTGITRMEIVDDLVGIVRLNLRQKIGERHFLSLIGNYGITHNNLTELFAGSHLWGCGVEYAYNSMVGPISANLSFSNRHKNVIFFLNLGYYF
jgi:NTE family protein